MNKFTVRDCRHINFEHETCLLAINKKEDFNKFVEELDKKSGLSISLYLKVNPLDELSNGEIIIIRPNIGHYKNIVITIIEDHKSLSWLMAMESAIHALKTYKLFKNIDCYCCNNIPLTKDTSWCIRSFRKLVADSFYKFNKFKTNASCKCSATCIDIVVDSSLDLDKCKLSLDYACISAVSSNFAKDLVNTPANICTPTWLAEQAAALSEKYALNIKVLCKKEIIAHKMGGLLSVAAGSAEDPRFIELTYKGADSDIAPIVLIGKGVTFDTGGTSLKPSKNMHAMKADMGGAATVLAAIKGAAMLKLPLNIVVLVPATENMPGSRATKPGDVITTMSTKTVEVLNTDAEGRMILCDALTYAERFNPSYVIDAATLTGACVVALGTDITAVYSTDDTLAKELVSAGEYMNDTCWHMPIHEAYDNLLKSSVADISNISSSPYGGSITATLFLRNFCSKFSKWAHLDIAGPAFNDGASSTGMASGRPVSMLIEWLKSKACSNPCSNHNTSK